MTLERLLDAACAVRPATGCDDVDGVPARVVARPTSAQETSALLRTCSAQGLAVVVRGHGSKLEWGRPPERVDVVLETGAMAQLVEHSRGDLVATAGAGMPLSRLRHLLSGARHELVVDDLAVGRGTEAAGSTLGGAVATNLSGPRRLRAGPLRDLVIGVRLVLADGTVAKAGGKVVKNVAGYDLGKLVTGSLGTLAVITEVTVRLHPEPPQVRQVLARVPHERLAPVLAHLVASQLAPHTLEVHAEPGGHALVSVGLGGGPGSTQRRADLLALELAAPGLAGDAVAVVDPEHTTPEEVRHVVPDAGRPWSTAQEVALRPTLLAVTARLSGIPELVQVANDHGLTVSGSAGVGVLRATLPEPTPVATVLETVTSVRAVTTGLGGSTVVLDAPPTVKSALDPAGTWGPVPGLELMRRVKAQFDPGRTLAPGRFVGGL
ncbi:FAD-binding oxidoreductase [uncultured Serinicoccus sp.]|uniref:FAD-binding oxidoreductase n=1 Tax=uncultured Serinicoccus sp. TaxID=735514 RepID=UPI0026185A39|nr:FAD-binding oxidoreductase [uncultured Serinicoccus sp.]